MIIYSSRSTDTCTMTTFPPDSIATLHPEPHSAIILIFPKRYRVSEDTVKSRHSRPHEREYMQGSGFDCLNQQKPKEGSAPPRSGSLAPQNREHWDSDRLYSTDIWSEWIESRHEDQGILIGRCEFMKIRIARVALTYSGLAFTNLQ